MLNAGAVCSEIGSILYCSNPLTTRVCYVYGHAIDTAVNKHQNFAHNRKGAFEAAIGADAVDSVNGLGDLLQGNIQVTGQDEVRS